VTRWALLWALLWSFALPAGAQTDIGDFTDLDPVIETANLADQWPSLIRAVQGLGAMFSAKYATGTEPSDALHGLILADEAGVLAKAWRIRVDTNEDVLFERNTGTDATPIWTTKLTIDTSLGIGTFAPLVHQHNATDVNAGTLADARISQSSVDQYGVSTPTANRLVKGKSGSSEIDEGWISELGVTQHEAALSIAGSQLTGVLGKATIWIPASAMRPTTTGGCAPLTQVELAAGKPELLVIDCDGTTDESVTFFVAMPHSWNKGNISFKFFYTVNAAVNTTVQFSLVPLALADDDAIGVTTFSGGAAVSDTFKNTANDLAVSPESGGFAVAGSPGDDELTWFLLQRNPSVDTTTQDARLLGITLLYTRDAHNDN